LPADLVYRQSDDVEHSRISNAMKKILLESV
jgi:hypothetical protein